MHAVSPEEGGCCGRCHSLILSLLSSILRVKSKGKGGTRREGGKGREVCANERSHPKRRQSFGLNLCCANPVVQRDATLLAETLQKDKMTISGVCVLCPRLGGPQWSTCGCGPRSLCRRVVRQVSWRQQGYTRSTTVRLLGGEQLRVAVNS